MRNGFPRERQCLDCIDTFLFLGHALLTFQAYYTLPKFICAYCDTSNRQKCGKPEVLSRKVLRKAKQIRKVQKDFHGFKCQFAKIYIDCKDIFFRLSLHENYCTNHAGLVLNLVVIATVIYVFAILNARLFWSERVSNVDCILSHTTKIDSVMRK